MKKIILYKNITKTGIFIVYIVYVLWRKKQTNTHFEILGYFSQQIFFQKPKVAGMKLFVYAEAMWAFTFARLRWMFESERRERRDRIRYNELRRENWTSRRFHTDYFNIEVFLWRCNNDPIKQVTILSTVQKCERKSWISDSVQQLVVLQRRCADVKLLWEIEREKTRSSWITHTLFSNDWFNLLVCVDLFTHNLLAILNISLIINLKAAGMSKTMWYTNNPPRNSGHD